MVRGFTLLELMVAIAILAMMSLAMFGASTQMISTQERVQGQDEFQHSVSFAMGRMARDLGEAYIVKNRELLGTQFDGEIAFEGTEERVDFVSFAHVRFVRDAKESDSAEISYYLVPDAENREAKTLMRRESAQIDKNLQEGGRAYPLVGGVRSLRFEYLPVGDDEWRKIWDTKSVDSGSKLPRAVKMTLEFPPEEEGGDSRVYTEVVRLHMIDPLAF